MMKASIRTERALFSPPQRAFPCAARARTLLSLARALVLCRNATLQGMAAPELLRACANTALSTAEGARGFTDDRKAAAVGRQLSLAHMPWRLSEEAQSEAPFLLLVCEAVARWAVLMATAALGSSACGEQRRATALAAHGS